ncbi:DUF2971 domain-containing protein [Endozoicomonas sp. GU-1]|uniref:DUF2971 domain-containing protein n=1 Tax=Endozoicomonas sp. GU-1 TaxID=3009078 RepID=UPI0022B4189A|nr:DUF2971 domain-containing protein [Endozoicomonas sp. GU-1]WBA81420.1 DUF2971 domain-containing protein [Endozoicomonas sp. GU-1]WBA84368.1 DUF2971 domain-containing protein [Endozoicomonas sp. GU-1]
MNDYKEVSWFVEKVFQEFQKVVNDENREIISKFWDYAAINRSIPYLCSFSNNGDVLSQWRAYANDGKGLSIGFNKENLKIRQEFPCTHVSSEYSVGLLSVLYDEEKQNHTVLSSTNKKDAHFLKSEESTAFIHFLNDSIDHCKNFSFIPNRKRIKSTQ